MDKKVKLLIIGAGTAGLSAYKEASKYTDDILLVDRGPLGSTCARVGCMPSKVLLQVAHSFHERLFFKQQGIHGMEGLTVDIKEVLNHVRTLRDYFTKGVVEYTESLKSQFIATSASFIAPNKVLVGNMTIEADAIIIATGSSSFIPPTWTSFSDKILTSETLFEQKNLAKYLGLVGLGSIGLEFGQALSRLGIRISAFHNQSNIGGLTDPYVNKTAIDIFKNDFSIYLNEEARVTFEDEQLLVKGHKDLSFDQIIAAMGRRANLSELKLEHIGLTLNKKGLPNYDCTTMQVENYPIFLVGDVNQDRALLHEAADEGRIAAFNALHPNQCFQRRTPIRIIFTEPNIAVIGTRYHDLNKEQLIIGEVDYSNQGRARIMQKNQGLLRIYADKEQGLILGSEMIAPGGEHLAHLLAWAIDKQLTATEILQMPFYHPVIEEGMRTALRQISDKAQHQSSAFDLAMCDSEALHSLT